MLLRGTTYVLQPNTEVAETVQLSWKKNCKDSFGPQSLREYQRLLRPCQHLVHSTFELCVLLLSPGQHSQSIDLNDRTTAGKEGAALGWQAKKQKKMGVLLDEPKYPVIDRSPSAGTTVGNFNVSDYLKITALTAGSLPWGYLAGGSVNIRGPSMYTAGIIGLMGGFMFAYQCSAGRLMGFFPNEGEVARYKR